jgi:hypothetical protein
MDVQQRIDNLHAELIALRRLVVDLGRDLGPLRDVTTVSEFRTHWATLSKSHYGIIYLRNWWWKFALHQDETLRLSRVDADKILEALEGLEK